MKITSFEKSNNKYAYLLLAFAIPFIGMLLVFLISGYQPFGGASILYSDMYHQYYPFFVAFRKALLSGESLLWNWSVGMGMDYLGLISYYLASPLYLFSVFVPEDLLLEYFSLLVPIKLGLASLFFAIFLKKVFHRNDASIAIFGGFYGLCAWAMGYLWNIMWLDTYALLPLVALGTLELIRDKKVILYTVTLFLSIYSNYYIGFFTCIFVFLIFFCIEFCRWPGFKRFFLDLCRIAVFSILAIGMTMFLEIPALAALQNTQSSVNQFPTEFRLNMVTEHTWQGLLDAMRKVAGNMGGAIAPSFKEGLPNVATGLGTLFLAFLFLTAKQVKFRDKLCCVALLIFFMVSFIIRQLDYIWHGFHFTNMIPYRFSFLFSFVLLYMAYRAYLLHRTFKPWQFVVAGGLAAAVLAGSDSLQSTVTLELYDLLPFASNMGWENRNLITIPYFLLYNAIVLALYLIVLLHGRKRVVGPRESTPEQHKRYARRQIHARNAAIQALAVVLVAELVLSLVNFGVSFTGTYITNYPKGTEYTASMVRYMYEREEGEPFFRAEVTHAQTLNDGAINGYDGISTFTSSANVKVTTFMQSLGYGAKNTYNRYCFEESSPVANLFLNLKYMLERDADVEPNAYFEEIHHYGDTYLLKNKAYLPLGFLAESELADVVFTTAGNRFSMQNFLLSSASGIHGQYWTAMPTSTLEITADDSITLNGVSRKGNASYKADSAGYVYFTYTAHDEGFLCMDLNLTKKNNFSVYLNDELLYTESYSLPQMIALCQVKKGDEVKIRFTCKAEEKGTIDCKTSILDQVLFDQAYSVLNASTLELTKFSTDHVEGTISCDRDGLLYTSIPQDGNWSVTVDGKPAEAVLVGEVMLSVPLTAGEHTVAFSYRNKAFEFGAMVSLACLAIFALLVWRIYPPVKKVGKYEKV